MPDSDGRTGESRHPHVAILLATYNGERFVDTQIRSLSENKTPFKVHWIDDHSTDRTRDVLRAAASGCDVNVQEWHQRDHLGVPGTFFRLLECVEADIYLFCDQDDIWQPGKIDATVNNLLPDIDSTVLCCSDPLIFRDDQPEVSCRVSDMTDAKAGVALNEARLFMTGVAYGHTQGFTRPLRDIYVKHHEIAVSHAYMHDEWMHNIAVASGVVRILSDVPTTLYRWHASNSTNGTGGWRWNKKGGGRITMTWSQMQQYRRMISKQARGFILAAPTLPAGPKRERALEVARKIATLDRRQTLVSLAHMLRRGMLLPTPNLVITLAASCLYSDAVA